MRKNRRFRPAFTLVELLVVMGIITLLAAVTLPSIRTLLQGQKVTQASRTVQAHIEAARARAIASGKPVAVVLERSNDNNAVLALTHGQVFPPYEGDTIGAAGTLADVNGRNPMTGKYDGVVTDGFYDQITIGQLEGSLLFTKVYGEGDFIQIGDRESVFLIRSVSQLTSSTVVQFYNPPIYIDNAGYHWKTHEEQLPVRGVSSASFRVYRKPTKSFGPPIRLPRGTCVDLTVSGSGLTGNEFSSTSSTVPVMIVFDERGTVAYITDDSALPKRPNGIIHLMIGRTEQVSLSTPTAVLNDGDSSSFNANVNDKENVWVSINPFSGAVYSSSVLAGSESSALGTRLAIARSLATNATTRSVD